MRVVPRHWRVEALWCSTSGHVTPANQVATLRPQDGSLGVDHNDDSRLCRCLRCDDWINVSNPTEPESEFLPEPDDLPTPERGKALEEIVVIRGIAVIRGLHCIFFSLAVIAIIIFEWGLPGLRDEAQSLVESAGAIADGSRPGNSLLVSGLEKISSLDAAEALKLLALALGYAILEGIEAVYLWRGKRWAEYLTVIAVAALLPLTVHALIEKVTVFRILGLAIELAILIYLVWTKRLFGARVGTSAYEREMAADTNWEQLHRVAPIQRPTAPESDHPD